MALSARMQWLKDQGHSRGQMSTMNGYLTAKVEDGLQPMGSLFGVSMPYSITTVHNRKDVGYKIKDKERAEKKPRQTTQKIDSVRNLRYDMVYMIIPRQGVI